ncbi:hypothetical protein M514_11577, partial [Trichuris suis]
MVLSLRTSHWLDEVIGVVHMQMHEAFVWHTTIPSPFARDNGGPGSLLLFYHRNLSLAAAPISNRDDEAFTGCPPPELNGNLIPRHMVDFVRK